LLNLSNRKLAHFANFFGGIENGGGGPVLRHELTGRGAGVRTAEGYRGAGERSAKVSYGAGARITKDRGRWFETKYGVPAIATYHPAYLLRLTGQDIVKAKWEVFYDLKAAVEKCRELVPEWEPTSAEKPDLLLAMYEGRRQKRRSRKVKL